MHNAELNVDWYNTSYIYVITENIYFLKFTEIIKTYRFISYIIKKKNKAMIDKKSVRDKRMTNDYCRINFILCIFFCSTCHQKYIFFNIFY